MYRILISADVPGWAYHRRAVALKKYAPPDFDVTVCYHSNPPTPAESSKAHDLGEYDLFFNLCYMTRGFGKQLKNRGIKTKLVISHNRDSSSRLENWDDTYQPTTECDAFIICNNLEVFDFHSRLPRTCNISNGVDADLWASDVPIMNRPKTVLWSGSGNPKKAKGWDDILRPMMPILHDRGFLPHFRPFHGGSLADWAYSQEEQREWYNSGAIILCTSEHEGTPNTTLEGMLCGCALVSTNVGNVREFGVQYRRNCVICPREVDAFVDGIEYAWKDRERLSFHAASTMNGWTYGEPGNRAAYFYQLFRRMIDEGGDSIEPFTFLEKSPEEI